MAGSIGGFGSAGKPLRQSATLKRADLFAIPTFYTDLQLDNQSMIDALYSIKQEDPEGLHRSNTIGWHSSDDLNHRSEFMDLSVAVTNIVTGLITSEEYKWLFTKNEANYFPSNVTIGNMWGMISPPLAYNVTHNHPGCDLSGVYYLSVPQDSGCIEFYHPSDSAAITGYGRATETFTVHPGRLIFFPPWLKHSVQQNRSQYDRLCVSFNISIG